MSFTLHAATVPNWLQILGSAKGWLDKAEAHEGILDAKLADDMWPFAKQISVLAAHSQGAVEGARQGLFTPDFSPAPTTFAELRAKLDGAIAYLEALTAEEMQTFVDKPMRFEVGEKKLPFTADNFLLTFSQTNFFFHAVTAYGILRANGVAVGKLDYLGKLRLALPA